MRTVVATDGGVIEIRNAKYDEDGRRACAEFRFYRYDDTDARAYVSARIGEGLRRLACGPLGEAVFTCNEAEWETEREKCQRLLCDTCKGLGLPPYYLYDLRHQFGADLKLHLDGDPDASTKTAALMGHASSRTASRHYARKNAGGRRRYYPEADERNMPLVRDRDNEWTKEAARASNARTRGQWAV